MLNLNYNKKNLIFKIQKSFLSINANNYDNVKVRLFNEPLNIFDINSSNSGSFSKDLTENNFNFLNGNNFQHFLLMNNGVLNNHMHLSTNISFLNLNELFLNKVKSQNINSSLFFLFWEGTPRREMTGLTVYIGNLLFYFGGISCTLGSRSNLLWPSLSIGGGRFKKISYISGRSGIIKTQRSFIYEGSRIFFSSNSEKKNSYILNNYYDKMRNGSLVYDMHYSLSGLSFLENTSSFKNLKNFFNLNFYLLNKKQIKVNNFLVGSLDEKISKRLQKSMKIHNLYFFDSYKISGKIFKNLKISSLYGISIPSEYENTNFIQNIHGNFILVPKVLTVRSQLIRSFSLISNILIDSFFSKYLKKLEYLFNLNLNNKNLIFKNQLLELKNRVYSLIETKSNFIFNYKKLKNNKIYLMSETSSPYVQLNICSVDGPSKHSRTMVELNWALQINNNFN